MAEQQQSLRVTVMGLGLFGGGVGAARYFSAAGHEVTVTDLRSADALAASVESLDDCALRFELGGHPEELFTNCDLLVVNPGVRPDNKYVETAVRSGARTTTEFETGLRIAASRGARVLAVTGTNGKSTTVAMLQSILTAASPDSFSGGNFGGSLIELAGKLPNGASLLLECSSFQLFRAQSFPGLEVGVITNLAPNHLDWHPTLDHYYSAKKKLLECLGGSGCAVLAGDDPVLRRWGEESDGPVRWVHPAPPQDRDAAVWADGNEIVLPDGRSLSLESVAVHGPHDLANAAAAVAAADAFGVGVEPIQQGLNAYRPLHHRLEVVARHEKLTFVDDSSSTTSQSSAAALEALDGPVAVIAGGSDKGLSFDTFADALRRKAVGVTLLGPAGKSIRAAIESAGETAATSVKLVDVDDLTEAFHKALEFLGDTGTLLLSPAAASFDSFRNYAERGDAFGGLARSWVERASGRKG